MRYFREVTVAELAHGWHLREALGQSSDRVPLKGPCVADIGPVLCLAQENHLTNVDEGATGGL